MNKIFFKFFIFLFAGTIFIIGLLTSAIWTVYERETTTQKQVLSEGSLFHSETMIRGSLRSLLADASHLAFEVDLSTHEGNVETLEHNFFNMGLVRPGYKKLSLLDSTGKEILKVTNDGGFPRLAPEGELDDRSQEEFVSIAMSLKESQYYVPPISIPAQMHGQDTGDLQTIALVMPVFDNGDSKPCCLVRIDLAPDNLFSHLIGGAAQDLGSLFLVDAAGSMQSFSLHNTEKKQVLENGSNLAQLFPDVWNEIQELGAGVVAYDGRTFIFRRFDFIPEGQLFFEYDAGGTGIYRHPPELTSRYYMVSIIQEPSFFANFKTQPMLYFMAALFIGLSSGFFAWGGATLLAKRQSALQAISDNETFLRTVTDTMVDGLIVIDPAGTVQSMNQAAEAIFGYGEHDLVGKNITAIMFPELARQHDASIRRYLETGKSGILNKPARELVGRRRDGSEVKIELAISEFKDSHNHFFIGSIRDVTQTRQLQARFRLLAEQSRDVIVLSNRNAEILYVSPAVERILGYSQEEYINKKPFGYIHPEDLPKVLEAFETYIIGKKVGQNLTYRMRKKNGNYTWVEAAASPTLDAKGELTNVIVSLRDVAQRVELEERLRQSHKMEAVGQLTSGVSHEFNNILMSISGGLSMIEKDKNLKPQQKELIAMALKSAHKGAKLVKFMLSFAKKQTFKIEGVDVADFLKKIRPELEKHFSAKVALKFEVPKKAVIARTDPHALHTALDSLANNANDAMPDGGKFTISVTPVKLSKEEAEALDIVPGDYVRFNVSDSGCGMSAENLERAFDPFYTTKDVDEGSGLGLSMVLGFAQQSGGTADIESLPGKGTVVTLYLPKG